jgi:bifunctional UDP-N-acetylglucosamine pyrophosphorylase/glucosamine-1-phosphate N-acetyltransferase
MKRRTVVLISGGGERAVFRRVLGRPLGAYGLDAVLALRPDAVLVVSRGGDAGRDGWEDLIKGVETDTPIFLLPDGPPPSARRPGVLAALAAALPVLERYPACDLLAVPAETPLLTVRTLRRLLRAHADRGAALTFLSGPGNAGLAGALAVRSSDVFPLLAAGAKERARAGFGPLALRLTNEGRKVAFTECADEAEVLPVRDAVAAGRAARELQRRKNEALARAGAVLLDPSTAWIDWGVRIGPRTVVYPSVVIEGPTRIGPDGAIYPFVHIMGSAIGPRVKVLTSTVMEGTVLERDVQVGPFSRFRPKTRVRAGARAGNFVEMKNTDFGRGSKAQHLSYLGDSTIGAGVNVGAGTITCNYDGVSKNPTRIDAGAFIGSGTELVAPVAVGRGAYIAAGSTITRDVTAGALAVARARQVEKPAWVLERTRARKAARKGGRT